MQLTLGKDKYDQLSLHATGSALQEQYEALLEAKYIAGNRTVLDSLDHMFYAAREKGDREEMERIREVSSPYYESASEQTRKLINGEIAKNKGSYFWFVSLLYLSLPKIILLIQLRRLMRHVTS